MIGIILVVIVVALIVWYNKSKKKTMQPQNSVQNNQKNSCEPSPEIIQEIKADCKEIFNVVASYGVEHFDKGWRDRRSDAKYDCIGKELRDEIFRQTVQDLLFEGDDIVKNTLCDRFAYYSHVARLSWYARRGGVYNIEKALPTVAEHAAAVTIRALHFEKYGRNREEYQAITENDCREFVSNSEAFMRIFEQEIAKDPFNDSTKNWVNGMVNTKFAIFDWIQKEPKQSGMIPSYSNPSSYLPSDSEYYYADALCNAFWKYVAKKYQNGDSTDPNQVFEILLDYFKPGQHIFDELKSRDARRNAVHSQCGRCARYDSCRERNRVENCTAFLPRQR